MRADSERTPDRQSLEESVAQAMDGEGPEIVPYLPYILQDAWELGTLPGTVIDLVRRHLTDWVRLRVLDLGCGKGAVSVRLARELGCRCLGIDALEEFISVAREKAAAFGVRRRCRFEVGDIRDRIHDLGRFDVIVLGAIGPVFGGHRATLRGRCRYLGKYPRGWCRYLGKYYQGMPVEWNYRKNFSSSCKLSNSSRCLSRIVFP